MRIFRPQAGLLALVLAACFAPEGNSSTSATGTSSTTTTAADPTTAPGTSTDPATSTPDTTASPTTTTTGDSSSTTSTTTGTTTADTTTTTTSTTDTTTTTTTTGDDSTAATTLLDPECLADADCPNIGGECKPPACVDGLCTVKNAPVGSFCNGFQDQCDGLGLCVDCVDNGGCDECCVCSNGACIPA